MHTEVQAVNTIKILYILCTLINSLLTFLATLQYHWLGRYGLNGWPSGGLDDRQWWAEVGVLQLLSVDRAQKRALPDAHESPTNGPPTYPWVL